MCLTCTPPQLPLNFLPPPNFLPTFRGNTSCKARAKRKQQQKGELADERQPVQDDLSQLSRETVV